MSDNFQLYQDNAITRARYDLSASEMNILFHVLKQIRLEKSSVFIYQINVREIIDLEKDKATNYTALRKATKRLISRVIDIPTTDGYIQSAFISAANYQGGSGRILVQVSELIKPYLIDVAKNTTRYYFEIAVKLKSVYSKRFYQFISQWKVAGVWKVSVQELRERMQLEKNYKNYGDFKICVLNVAHQELILSADIYFTYEEIKQGRRVTELIFKIFPNSKYERDKSATAEQNEKVKASENLFPLDPNRLIQSLKQLDLSDWQIRNVLITFEKNNGDLFGAIYSINSTKTIVNKGAKAWAIFTKKYNVPLTKINS